MGGQMNDIASEDLKTDQSMDKLPIIDQLDCEKQQRKPINKIKSESQQ